MDAAGIAEVAPGQPMCSLLAELEGCDENERSGYTSHGRCKRFSKWVETRRSLAIPYVFMIQIQFNGEPHSIQEGTTLLQLLERFQVESRFCAVEINLDILPKSEYGLYALREGDSVEVVTLVGGG